MKFLVLCIVLRTSLALVEKRQDEPNWGDNTSEPRYSQGPTNCREVCPPTPVYLGPDWQPPTCKTVCERQAPNYNDDDDTIRVQASRYRRNINANIIEIREAPAKAIAIGLPPPLLNFGQERILRDESNEEGPIAERNGTDYVRSATMGEP